MLSSGLRDTCARMNGWGRVFEFIAAQLVDVR